MLARRVLVFLVTEDGSTVLRRGDNSQHRSRLLSEATL